MANDDAEPPRLVRPYIAPSPTGPGRPAEPVGPVAPAGGAHRPLPRPAPPHRPPPEPAGDEPVPGPGRRRTVVIAVAVAAVVALLAGLAVALLVGRDRGGPTAAVPSALPLPSALPAPPDVGGPSAGASATPVASSGSGTSSAVRSPSRAGTPRKSAPASASVGGTPAAANPDGANLALGRPAAASSVEGDAYAPRLAVDGDPRTRWSSAFSDPQWISVDLGRLWLVSAVTLRWEAAYGVSYDLAVSTDGTTWRSVWRTDEGAGGVREVRIAATPARFVRMTGTRRVGQYGYSLFEFEVR